MSSADIVKQAKVKTASVKRIHKELAYYEKERDREQGRVDKLKAEGADASDLKQAVSQPQLALLDRTTLMAGAVRSARCGNGDRGRGKKSCPSCAARRRTCFKSQP
jgi:hypothetical protein